MISAGRRNTYGYINDRRWYGFVPSRKRTDGWSIDWQKDTDWGKNSKQTHGIWFMDERQKVLQYSWHSKRVLLLHKMGYQSKSSNRVEIKLERKPFG